MMLQIDCSDNPEVDLNPVALISNNKHKLESKQSREHFIPLIVSVWGLWLLHGFHSTYF